MVEVFKTNVKDLEQALMLIDHIQKTFIGYAASFDLEDCDRILRVECTTGFINASCVIEILNLFGFKAEILPDEPPPADRPMLTSVLFLDGITRF
jgi:hypothetical protein